MLGPNLSIIQRFHRACTPLYYTGTVVYFMAEEMAEGSCQLPRDENGSEDSCGGVPSPPPPHLLEERSVTRGEEG